MLAQGADDGDGEVFEHLIRLRQSVTCGEEGLPGMAGLPENALRAEMRWDELEAADAVGVANFEPRIMQVISGESGADHHEFLLHTADDAEIVAHGGLIIERAS